MTVPARCPVCRGADSLDTVTRNRLPTMQNHVYRERAGALAARQGQLCVAVCRACGFAWNRTFDPALLEYDAGYDNAVPSAVMATYYQEIAAHLARRYRLDRGLVVDIGCGDGRFLRALADVVPACRGLGVDPALDRDRDDAGGRIRLVKGVFSSALVEGESPSLFVCRHVLEHMPAPVSFLQQLRTAMAGLGNVPLFLEVPDADWMLEQEAFWDFCYEHCNYFTATSLAAVVRRAGFSPAATRLAFGGQYRWMEASSDSQLDVVTGGESAGNQFAQRLGEYGEGERTRIGAARDILAGLKAQGSAIAIWGMATKGVIFTFLVDPDSALIDFCVDVNPNKQGCYVPGTGRLIEAPSALQRAGDRRVAVIVMNPNYLAEIRHQCQALGLTATFVTAGGQTVEQCPPPFRHDRA